VSRCKLGEVSSRRDLGAISAIVRPRRRCLFRLGADNCTDLMVERGLTSSSSRARPHAAITKRWTASVSLIVRRASTSLPSGRRGGAAVWSAVDVASGRRSSGRSSRQRRRGDEVLFTTSPVRHWPRPLAPDKRIRARRHRDLTSAPLRARAAVSIPHARADGGRYAPSGARRALSWRGAMAFADTNFDCRDVLLPAAQERRSG